MISLIIYITSFLVVAGIVAGITAFFYGNSNLITQELYSSADYNKLNLYFVKESEQKGNRVVKITPLNSSKPAETIKYIEFSNGDIYTYDNEHHTLYYNSICICEDVNDFRAVTEYSSGKEVVNTKITFSNSSYSCNYTMAQ